MRAGLVVALGLATQSAEPPAHAEKPEWVLDAQAPDHAVRGARSTLILDLKARAGFHVNDDYPLNFKPASNEGVTYAKARFDRSDGLLLDACSADASHHCAARLPVSFTPGQAGTARVGGTLSFSACDENRCLIEKVRLSVLVAVAER